MRWIRIKSAMWNLFYRRTRLKAFTLMEIVIALMLSFFILGILYLSYNMMERHFKNEYQKQLSSLVLLKSELEMDFFHADTIKSEQNSLLIFTQGKASTYFFQEDAILKKYNSTNDTLFKGDCHIAIETLKSFDWVKQLKVKIKIENDEMQLSFNKNYRPNQKLKDKEISFEY